MSNIQREATRILARATPPENHTLLLAMHNIISAKSDFEDAIARANTWPELRRLNQLCEDVVAGFAHLGANALRKADRL